MTSLYVDIFQVVYAKTKLQTEDTKNSIWAYTRRLTPEDEMSQLKQENARLREDNRILRAGTAVRKSQPGE